MAEYVVIGGLIAAGYALGKKNQQATTTPVRGATPGQINSAGVIQPSGPVPPHLIAGAALLDDNTIASMEADTVSHFRNSSGDRSRFISEALPVLAKEQIFGSNILWNNCGGQSYAGPPLAIKAAQGGQLALGLTTQASSAFGFGLGAASAAIPIAGLVLGAGLSIYGIISAHHKAAVANEQRLECQVAIPANYSLGVIETAVLNGTMTIQQGQQALDQLYTDAVSEARNGQAGQLTDTSGTCNAMCWVTHFLHAIILKKKNRYANLAA